MERTTDYSHEAEPKRRTLSERARDRMVVAVAAAALAVQIGQIGYDEYKISLHKKAVVHETALNFIQEKRGRLTPDQILKRLNEVTLEEKDAFQKKFSKDVFDEAQRILDKSKRTGEAVVAKKKK